jgi:hypothetical protein
MFVVGDERVAGASLPAQPGAESLRVRAEAAREFRRADV